ncbi:MAG: insulinase family protein [Halioglobus sp.]
MSSLYFGKGVKVLLPVLACLVLVSCSTLSGSGLTPVKSPNDDNEYRFITLDNDLQVLLISDPETKKAAAALDVRVGSGDNPPGRGGLAHFLEHMLFLGTDKYPNAAEYEEFITEHGGNRNAYTSLEHTNYFFDINEAFLPEALDRFGQFFIAPRFDAQYVEREKNAVEAEYQMGLKSDGRRGLDVVQEIMNPDHPFSQFTVGSLDTLADRPGAKVRDDLLKFYEKHYSANQMKLAVLGSQTLDELEALVRPIFSAVPNKSFEYDDIEEPLFSSLPLLVQVQPQATLRQLQVAFPIADYRLAYETKPLSYLGNLVGHEGKGSLLSSLKAEGLAEGLGAGAGLAWRGGSLFSISVSLTEAGAQNYERVLQLVFAYMDMLREEGSKQWLYDEQSQLADLGFRFRSSPEPMGYVSGLVSGMHVYKPRDVLRGPSLMREYDADMFEKLLSALVPENALVTFSDQLAETDRVSKYYEVPYSAETVSPEEFANWRSDVGISALSLPTPNNFIAEDVSLKPISADNSAVPQLALEQPRQKIWFQQDEEFRIPKGATYINFRSSEVGKTARQTAAAVLYTALLKDSVNEFAYPALLAGLRFDLYKHAQGISLRVSGYNDKQAILLEQLLATIKTSEFDAKRFTNIRKDMIRSLENAIAARPSSQVIADLRESLLYGEWGEKPLIEALEQIDQVDLDRYQQSFWRSAEAEALIYGNYDFEAVTRVSAVLSRLLPDQADVNIPALKVLRLDSNESLQYQVDVPHDDSVVAWYLQGAGNSWEDRAAVALTAQIMKSGFFQQLRTEQQLGYVASAFAWPQLDVPGLVMLIQSPNASAADVAAAMDDFIGGVEQSLNSEQFERHKQALLSDILRPDKNIWDRAEFYWQSIAKKQSDFSGRETMAKAVEGLSQESWSQYFQAVFLDERHSLQVIAPGKWGDLPAGDFQHFDTASEIKEGHRFFQIN